eukprot:CAMPEP_0176472490 /NCGR_PEP_ID=MMETSP0127-20121128/41772_1 /TAXON_ID=938130 /ORGANISM="Platyophrya macrostoma, Strain WH" /LENGTH=490 /DNA_ID=CAMNT_0017867365 /DNA_START=52 /DNA_END=1521 /DNA_ORIENTATION=-
MTDHFQSVNSMIENLRSDDPELRLSSMRGIHVIAQTLGPERTKSELLPFLTDYLDESDDVLRVFANALATMIGEVGGILHVQSLLQPLELLCGLDEVTVRDEAVTSLQTKAIFKSDGAAVQQQDYVSLVQRLAKAEFPQARASACSLIATPYPTVPVAVKATLRQTFQKLCADEEIMVRRSACIALGKPFAAVLGQQCSDLLTQFAAFCRDASDGVRVQAVPTALALLGHLPDAGISQVVTLLKTLSSDSSWRVRYMVADRIGGFTKVFSSLCQDAEPEIRAAAVFNMHFLLGGMTDATVKKDMLNIGTRLAADANAHVRMSLASDVLQCVPSVPKDLWSSVIASCSTRLLNDADADVRLALLTGFSTMSMSSPTEASEIAPKLVPVVIALFNDTKWRVRDTVVLQVPSLVTSLGKSADEVLDVCVKSLQDRVSSIRASGCMACAKLVQESGAAWAEQHLFPKILALASAGPFVPRLTFLQLMTAFAAIS